MTIKTENLLKQYARQLDSETEETSSATNATRLFASDEEAEETFSRLCKKLLRIKHWNECSDFSSFMLYDKSGNWREDTSAAVGDFIKITLHGSGKADWVKVIEIFQAPNEIVLTVQPSPDPTDADDKAATSHFFTGDSTNNFCLLRKNSKLNFFVIGLDEKANTAETSGVIETIRNAATANLGRYLGIQKFQWQTFRDNFLETGEKGEMKSEK